MTESCRLVTTEQYKEYQELKEQCDHWHKEAERISHEAIGTRLESIALKKKLDIAVKTLENMLKFPAYYNDYTSLVAKKTLKEIEEVK